MRLACLLYQTNAYSNGRIRVAWLTRCKRRRVICNDKPTLTLTVGAADTESCSSTALAPFVQQHSTRKPRTADRLPVEWRQAIPLGLQ